MATATELALGLVLARTALAESETVLADTAVGRWRWWRLRGERRRWREGRWRRLGDAGYEA